MFNKFKILKREEKNLLLELKENIKELPKYELIEYLNYIKNYINESITEHSLNLDLEKHFKSIKLVRLDNIFYDILINEFGYFIGLSSARWDSIYNHVPSLFMGVANDENNLTMVLFGLNIKKNEYVRKVGKVRITSNNGKVALINTEWIDNDILGDKAFIEMLNTNTSSKLFDLIEENTSINYDTSLIEKIELEYKIHREIIKNLDSYIELLFNNSNKKKVRI